MTPWRAGWGVLPGLLGHPVVTRSHALLSLGRNRGGAERPRQVGGTGAQAAEERKDAQGRDLYSTRWPAVRFAEDGESLSGSENADHETWTGRD